MTISETWLNTSVTSGEIKLDDYKVFRLDRLHKRGGGVCAYVRTELKTKVLKDYSHISDSNFQHFGPKYHQCRLLNFTLVQIPQKLSFFEHRKFPTMYFLLKIGLACVIKNILLKSAREKYLNFGEVEVLVPCKL